VFQCEFDNQTRLADLSATVAAEDHIDRLLARIAAIGVETIDLDVEGIVDRIGSISINRRIKRAQEEILRTHDLTPADWGVLTTLRLYYEGSTRHGRCIANRSKLRPETLV